MYLVSYRHIGEDRPFHSFTTTSRPKRSEIMPTLNTITPIECMIEHSWDGKWPSTLERIVGGNYQTFRRVA